MAKIKTEECNSIKAELTEYLTKLQEDTKAVKTAIEGFYDIPKDKIDGADFNKVKAHLRSYSELFESIQSEIDELNVAQGKANDKMENYVDGYSTCSASNITEPGDEGVPEVTDPVNNEDMLDIVTQIEQEKHDDYDYKKEHECIEETKEAIEDDTGYIISVNIVHHTACEDGVYFHSDEVNAAYRLWRKYLRAKKYLLLLKDEDSAAYEMFNTAITTLKTDIDTQNEMIVEMTIKASVKNAIVSGNLDLDSVRDSAVKNGLDYDSGYYDDFNSNTDDGTNTETNSNVGSTNSIMFRDNTINNTATGVPAFGDVVGMWKMLNG